MTIKDLIQELLEYPLDTQVVMATRDPDADHRVRYAAEVWNGYYRPISNWHGMFIEASDEYENEREGADVKCVAIWPVSAE